MFALDPTKNIIEQKAFWCLQGDQERILRIYRSREYLLHTIFLPIANIRGSLLHLRETYKALQLPVFFSLFSCHPCPRLRNCKSVFLILKISQYGGLRCWVQLFAWYSCKNWYIYFHKTYDHQIRPPGTSRGVDSNETNQACADDVITLRSRNKLKTYLHFQSAIGHQAWQDGNLPWWTIKSHDPLITWFYEITWQTKTIISPLPQNLWPPNLTGWWLTLRGSYPWCYSTLWSRGFVRSRDN